MLTGGSDMKTLEFDALLLGTHTTGGSDAIIHLSTLQMMI